MLKTPLLSKQYDDDDDHDDVHAEDNDKANHDDHDDFERIITIMILIIQLQLR